MPRPITHTSTPEWVDGTRVHITYSSTNTDGSFKTATGTITEPKPRHGDPGPYRVPWVKVDPDGPYGPQDRPFPADWLTIISIPSESEGDTAA